jgi:hypothetical protein
MSFLLISPFGERLASANPLAVWLQPGSDDRAHLGQAKLRFQAFNQANNPVPDLEIEFSIANAVDPAETEFETVKTKSARTNSDGQVSALITLDFRSPLFNHRRLFAKTNIDGRDEQVLLQFIPADDLPPITVGIPVGESETNDLSVGSQLSGSALPPPVPAPDAEAVPRHIPRHNDAGEEGGEREATLALPTPPVRREDLAARAARREHKTDPDLPEARDVSRFGRLPKGPTPKPAPLPPAIPAPSSELPGRDDEGSGTKSLPEEDLLRRHGIDPAALRKKFEELKKKLEYAAIVAFEQELAKLQDTNDDMLTEIKRLVKEAESDIAKKIRRAAGEDDWSNGSPKQIAASLAIAALALGAIILLLL